MGNISYLFCFDFGPDHFECHFKKIKIYFIFCLCETYKFKLQELKFGNMAQLGA